MIGLIILIIALVVVLAAAPFLLDEKGYVLISFNNTTIEGTIVSFAVLTIAVLVVSYLTYKLVRYLFSIYRNTKHGFFARSQGRKQAAIEQALWSVINDDYAQIEQALSSKVPDQYQDIRLALLAKAALANNQTDKALEYLFDINPEQQLKVAKLWLASGNSSAIESQLRVIAESKKATALELKIYTEVLVQQQHFSALEAFLPRLLRKKVLTNEQWHRVFNAYFASFPVDEVTAKYKQLPKKLHSYAYSAYLTQMAAAGQLSVIENDLIKMVKHEEQHAQLANILSKATTANARKLQTSIQDRLKKDEQNNSLLLALACLANAQGDYDLAARVFDKALNNENKKQYMQQAKLSYEKSAQLDKALVLYK